MARNSANSTDGYSRGGGHTRRDHDSWGTKTSRPSSSQRDDLHERSSLVNDYYRLRRSAGEPIHHRRSSSIPCSSSWRQGFESFTSAPRIQKFLKDGGWRHRMFARLVLLTQHKYLVSFIYFLILCTFVTPVIGFLRFQAVGHIDDTQGSFLDFDQMTVKAINVSLVVFYGVRDVVLFTLACGSIEKKTIIYSLAANVIVWCANLAVWIDICLQDEFNDDNSYILSIAGVMSALQLNTFMLLNAILDSLVKTKKGVMYRIDDTIPCTTIEELIESSDIDHKYKIVLTEELASADFDTRGELDPMKFFEFNNKAMVWFEKWTSRGLDEKELIELRGLMDKLQFHHLMEKKARASVIAAPLKVTEEDEDEEEDSERNGGAAPNNEAKDGEAPPAKDATDELKQTTMTRMCKSFKMATTKVLLSRCSGRFNSSSKAKNYAHSFLSFSFSSWQCLNSG